MQVLFFALSCLTFSSTLQRLSAFLWQTGDVKASIIDSIAKVASGVEKVLLKPIVVAPASLPLPQHLDIVITKKTAEFKSLQCYQHGPPLPSNSAYRTREWSRYNAFLLSRAKLSYILFPADRPIASFAHGASVSTRDRTVVTATRRSTSTGARAMTPT